MDILPIRFFIGGFCSLVLVAFFIWDAQWESWVDLPPRLNSLIAMTTVYVLSFMSIQRFSVYMGQLNLRYVFSVLVLWIVAILGLLFVLRLQYSVYF